MKLKKLLKEISFKQVKGNREIEITGICSNSKRVAPGNLFVARKGKVEDGARYIPEAVSAGAVAVLTDIYDPTFRDVTQLIHSDVGSIEGLLAAHYYQHPSEELFMVGVTGTNGKTTTSFLIKYLLDQYDGFCGLIGTIEYIIGHHRYQPTHTTPDVVTNHKLLKEMLLHGCKSAVMEVTSHALEQKRVEYINYDVAVFTNLTLDHLDYHHTMEEYCEVKRQLFASLGTFERSKKSGPKIAVVNIDSPWSVRMLEGCKAKVLTYGIGGPADVRASDIRMTGKGTHFILTYEGTSIPCTIPLIGRYSIYNALAAISVLITKKAPLKWIVSQIASFPPVSGRLEPVANSSGLQIYVDFAHSPDALQSILECLRELKPRRIITVFGCGGDRDPSKRFAMGQAAQALSDFTIITTDNPRSEDPAAIAKQIAEAFKSKDSYMIELDRFKAIKRAIDEATAEDTVLIAGKGHESYQIFAHKIVEFDDRKVAAQIALEKGIQGTGAHS